MGWYDFLTYGDFGWGGQIIPLILALGMAFWIARKSRDFMLLQFPFVVSAKVIFPFFSIAFVYASLGIVVVWFFSIKDEVLSEFKSVFTGPKEPKVPEWMKTNNVSKISKEAVQKTVSTTGAAAGWAGSTIKKGTAKIRGNTMSGTSFWRR